MTILEHVRGIGCRLMAVGGVIGVAGILAIVNLGPLLSVSKPTLIALVLLVPVAGGFGFAIGLLLAARPDLHPEVRRAARKAGGTERLLEATGPAHHVFKTPSLSLTSDWVFVQPAFGILVRSLEDLAWVHPLKHRVVYGGATVQEHEGLSLHFLNQPKLNVIIGGEQAGELVQRLLGIRPDIVVGYHEELEGLWRTQRKEFKERARLLSA